MRAVSRAWHSTIGPRMRNTKHNKIARLTLWKTQIYLDKIILLLIVGVRHLKVRIWVRYTGTRYLVKDTWYELCKIHSNQ